MASRRARVVTLAIAIVAAAVLLLLPTVLGGWAPLLHNVCNQTAGRVETLYAWVPALIVNSPYGGRAWGNGTVPPGPLSGSDLSTVFAGGAANGSAIWSGFRAEVNVSREENQTQWGPGSDRRCTTPFSLSVRYWGGYVLGAPILGQGNTSDSHEPTSLGYWTYPGDVNLTIANGFVGSNSGPVSTCGTVSSSNFTGSVQFVVRIPVTSGGLNYSVPYLLPIQETFHYWFPGNFGRWQIDDLSAPGGPGGGWAFSYSPCP
jgi:hypothetical protein